jgi:NAD-dependent dihydropyrimidine dehydrogenase PreA subunit
LFHIPGELRNQTEHIRLNTKLCKACWKCIEACPEGVIGRIRIPFHKHTVIENSFACTGCLKCIKACPEKAIIPVKYVFGGRS